MTSEQRRLGYFEARNIKGQPEWIAAAAEQHPETPAVVFDLVDQLVVPRLEQLKAQQIEWNAQRESLALSEAETALQALRRTSPSSRESQTVTLVDPQPKIKVIRDAAEKWNKAPANAATIARLLELVPDQKPKDLEKLVQAILDAEKIKRTADNATAKALKVDDLLNILDDKKSSAAAKETQLGALATKAAKFQRMAADAQAKSQLSTRQLRQKLDPTYQETANEVATTEKPIPPENISLDEANAAINEIFGQDISPEQRRVIAKRGGVQEGISPKTFERAEGVYDGLLKTIVNSQKAYDSAAQKLRDVAAAESRNALSPTELLTTVQDLSANSLAKRTAEAELVNASKGDAQSSANILTLEDFDRALEVTTEQIDSIKTLFESTRIDLVFDLVQRQLVEAGVGDNATLIEIMDLLKDSFHAQSRFGYGELSYPMLINSESGEMFYDGLPATTTTKLDIVKAAEKKARIEGACSALEASGRTDLATLIWSTADKTHKSGSIPSRIEAFVQAVFTNLSDDQREALQSAMKVMEYYRTWGMAVALKRIEFEDQYSDNLYRTRRERNQINERRSQYLQRQEISRRRFEAARDVYLAQIDTLFPVESSLYPQSEPIKE